MSCLERQSFPYILENRVGMVRMGIRHSVTSLPHDRLPVEHYKAFSKLLVESKDAGIVQTTRLHQSYSGFILQHSRPCVIRLVRRQMHEVFVFVLVSHFPFGF